MTLTFYKNLFVKLTFGILLAVGAVSIQAQTSTFTYQGRLTDNSMAANGSYDMQFKVFTAATGGAQQGITVTKTAVAVTNGVFTVQIDPTISPFVSGDNRFLEIAVRLNGSGAGYTTLAPRQQITGVPYSSVGAFAFNAQNAQNADALGSVPANQYVQTGDTRLTNDRNPLAGSPNYIQNNPATVQSGGFNISGNGSVGGNFAANNATVNGLTVNGAATVTGSIAGNGAGISGLNATNITLGTLNTARIPNLDAGKITTGTFSDSLFSANIPRKSSVNTFSANQIIDGGLFANTVDGTTITGTTINGTTISAATQFNLGGNRYIYAPGLGNIIVGRDAGANFTTGAGNAFFGTNAGFTNQNGNSNSFFGSAAGYGNTIGGKNTFIGESAGIQNTTGNNNTFIGNNAGNSAVTGGNTAGGNNTVIGAGASLNANNLTYATAIGAGAKATASNQIILGRPYINSNNQGDEVITARFRADKITTSDITIGDSGIIAGADGEIGIGGDFEDLYLNGRVHLTSFSNVGAAGDDARALCIGNSFLQFRIGTCNIAFNEQKDFQPFSGGINLIRRLRPVSYSFKSNNQRGIGFNAAEVNTVEPLLAITNDKGEVEGVKYDRISAALVNAVNEQQDEIKQQKTQITTQQTIIERQQKQIDALTKLFCATNANAVICKLEENK